MLDETDYGLIHALHLDGRAPFSRIGAVLGVSTQTVARRYRRLHAEAGLRVTGLPVPDRTGTTQWLVRLTATPAAAQRLAHALARRPDTSWVMLTSGGTEVFLLVDGPGPNTPSLLLHDLPRTSAITGISAQYVLHTYVGGPTVWPGHLTALNAEQQHALTSTGKTRYVPESPAGGVSAPRLGAVRAEQSGDDGAASPGSTVDQLHPAGRWPATAGSRRYSPSRRGRRPSPDSTRHGVCDSDATLFTALRADGRASVNDLSAATGWSTTTVARRIAELLDCGALYFDVDVEGSLFGITTRALLWATIAPGRLDEVAESLSGHAELAFVAATTGRTNLVAEVLCPDPAALHAYLTGKLGHFEAIQTLETTPVLTTVKSTAPVRPSSS
ncbi:Lrp/AsnC family transcriptional regulator [Nocardia alni]|uniref:Lrp/AsnC family transcriptional regulator n=1 Tax=Nocardia alni TaxID=2815723 RepID=UPI0020B42FD9|nr:AsnC family transcriptional regulator [Nocardia alni]